MWKVEDVDGMGGLFFVIDRAYLDEHYPRGVLKDEPDAKQKRETFCRPEAMDNNLEYGAAVTLCDMLNLERYGRLDAPDD